MSGAPTSSIAALYGRLALATSLASFENSNVMQAVAKRGMCVVQGHFHSRFEIGYLGNPDHLLWGMTAGCLIFNKSPAFEYDSHNLNRPIIGLSIIIDGLPKLLPMILNKKGRWNGYVP